MNPVEGLSWMAWTWQTGLFWLVILSLLVFMVFIEWRSPGGAPRRGSLGIRTTRGDRLFISLLSAGYLHLLWLMFSNLPLALATVLSVALAFFIFRYV
jgi:predicted small integral membrane protein